MEFSFSCEHSLELIVEGLSFESGVSYKVTVNFERQLCIQLMLNPITKVSVSTTDVV